MGTVAMADLFDWYQENYQRYFARTRGVNPASFLNPLVRHLKPGAVILDVGCGSGRDLKWLRERGFSVTGLERAKGLAALAREHAGCIVIEGDFEVYDFSSVKADALLLSGSLVHVPHGSLETVFNNIVRALKPEGILLISLKRGTGSAVDEEGRTFYYWERSRLDPMFSQAGFAILECRTSVSKVNPQDTWLSYLLRKSMN